MRAVGRAHENHRKRDRRGALGKQEHELRCKEQDHVEDKQLFDAELADDPAAPKEHRHLHQRADGGDVPEGIARADLGQLIGNERRGAVHRQADKAVANQKHDEVIVLHRRADAVARALFLFFFRARLFGLVVPAKGKRQRDQGQAQDAVGPEGEALRSDALDDRAEDDAHKRVADRAEIAHRAEDEGPALVRRADDPAFAKALHRAGERRPKEDEHHAEGDPRELYAKEHRHERVEHGRDDRAEDQHLSRRADLVGDVADDRRKHDAKDADDRHDDADGRAFEALLRKVRRGERQRGKRRPERRLHAAVEPDVVVEIVLQEHGGRKGTPRFRGSGLHNAPLFLDPIFSRVFSKIRLCTYCRCPV